MYNVGGKNFSGESYDVSKNARNFSYEHILSRDFKITLVHNILQ